MDTLRSAINMTRPNSYMVSVNLKDAYYSVPIAYCDKKYLKFEWSFNFTNLNALPMGWLSVH